MVITQEKSELEPGLEIVAFRCWDRIPDTHNLEEKRLTAAHGSTGFKADRLWWRKGARLMPSWKQRVREPKRKGTGTRCSSQDHASLTHLDTARNVPN